MTNTLKKGEERKRDRQERVKCSHCMCQKQRRNKHRVRLWQTYSIWDKREWEIEKKE